MFTMKCSKHALNFVRFICFQTDIKSQTGMNLRDLDVFAMYVDIVVSLATGIRIISSDIV